MSATMLSTLIKTIGLLRNPELYVDFSERIQEIRLRQLILSDCPKVIIEKNVIIINYLKGRLKAVNVRIAQGSILSFGDDHTGYSSIEIGEGTWIGQYNNLRVSENAPIKIGKKCLISQFCTIVGANHGLKKNALITEQSQSNDKQGVVIEDDVWLGAGVVVMPGVTIASGVVVGANSVVIKDIPSYEIWAGAPAKKIGERT